MSWVCIVLGPCMSAGIAACAYFLSVKIAPGNQTAGQSHWTGSAEFTRHTFELFAAVFLFGLLMLIAGIYQVNTGRRHPLITVLVLLLAGAIVYFGSGIVS